MNRPAPLPQKPQVTLVPFEGDFFSLFCRLERMYDTAFLLESSGEGYDSRYSIIGFAPEMMIRSSEGGIEVDGVHEKCGNPYYKLREFLPDNLISTHYAGGLVGYLSYDATGFFEPGLSLRSHPDYSGFEFGLYTDGLVYDTLTGELRYFTYRDSRLPDIKREIDSGPADAGEVWMQDMGDSISKDRHRELVVAAIEEIKAGNTFQCQIGFSGRYSISGKPLPVYARLREINPSPHMYYLKHRERVVLGASPELLYRQRQGEIETFPLAGTIKRGSNPEEDRHLVRKLLSDPKEIAEHNMLVDLHRNDIGRVAQFGTVKVRRIFDIKKFSHVQHISSEVVGILQQNKDAFDGVAAVFPAGTLSGAPKIESMKIIQRLEGDARGVYGGGIGHFGFNGDATFAIPIRSLFVSGSEAYVRASGGIVFDSKPEDEYQEIVNKMAAVRKAIEPFLTTKSGIHPEAV